MASLILPKHLSPPGKYKNTRPLRPLRTVNPVVNPAGMKPHDGRKLGNTESSWIFDLIGLRKPILLCWKCQPKFDHVVHHYHKDTRFPYVMGQCDGCKDHFQQKKFYIHQSMLTDTGGQSWSGRVWTAA